jgi:broad specificity phosphatase PhoE
MPARKLILIRHGEKEPDAGPPPYGVDGNGEQDKHSLSPRGWQRSGALVEFFRKPWAAGIETPDAIYASMVGAIPVLADGVDVSKSLRPQQTVTPLIEALAPAIVLQTPFAVGEETQLAERIQQSENGVVLIAWEHHHIPVIAAIFCSNAPDDWSGDRYDDVWILNRSNDGSYAFVETPQSLLSGDV